MPFVVGLECSLRGRQARALRVVHQVEHEAAVGMPVAERIETPERLEAGLEHAFVTLLLDVLYLITG